MTDVQNFFIKGAKLLMNISLLHSIFSWIAIIAAILTAISATGSWWTGRIIDRRREVKITALQKDFDAVKPRHLSPNKKNKLMEKISKQKAKIGFVSRLMDGESSDFADELAMAFKEAGWNVVDSLRTSLNDFPGFLSIFVTGENLNSVATFVCQAFKEIGIDCHPEHIEEGSIGGSRQPDTVYIVVGRKG
jgi:hypothetical protein